MLSFIASRRGAAQLEAAVRGVTLSIKVDILCALGFEGDTSRGDTPGLFSFPQTELSAGDENVFFVEKKDALSSNALYSDSGRVDPSFTSPCSPLGISPSSPHSTPRVGASHFITTAAPTTQCHRSIRDALAELRVLSCSVRGLGRKMENGIHGQRQSLGGRDGVGGEETNSLLTSSFSSSFASSSSSVVSPPLTPISQNVGWNPAPTLDFSNSLTGYKEKEVYSTLTPPPPSAAHPLSVSSSLRLGWGVGLVAGHGAPIVASYRKGQRKSLGSYPIFLAAVNAAASGITGKRYSCGDFSFEQGGSLESIKSDSAPVSPTAFFALL